MARLLPRTPPYACTVNSSATVEVTPGRCAHPRRRRPVELAVSLRRTSDLLAPRDQQIFQWRFVQELTEQEIASRLGISQMHVSRLLSSIARQLRVQL